MHRLNGTRITPSSAGKFPESGRSGTRPILLLLALLGLLAVPLLRTEHRVAVVGIDQPATAHAEQTPTIRADWIDDVIDVLEDILKDLEDDGKDGDDGGSGSGDEEGDGREGDDQP